MLGLGDVEVGVVTFMDPVEMLETETDTVVEAPDGVPDVGTVELVVSIGTTDVEPEFDGPDLGGSVVDTV